MKNDHGLRTKGTHTGNFGKAKVQGKRESLDLTKQILNRDNLRIPDPRSGYTRLWEAYTKTDDPKLKAFLEDQLKKYKATTTSPKVTPNARPRAPYWEMVRLVR
jgi:spore coat protein CotF